MLRSASNANRQRQNPDGAHHVQRKRHVRPRQQQRPERAQRMGLVKPRFEQRQDLFHMDQRMPVSTHDPGAVMHPGHASWTEAADHGASDDLPFARNTNTTAAASPNCGLKISDPMANPASSVRSLSQRQIRQREAQKRETGSLSPGQQVKKSRKGNCQDENRPAMTLKPRTGLPHRIATESDKSARSPPATRSTPNRKTVGRRVRRRAKPAARKAERTNCPALAAPASAPVPLAPACHTADLRDLATRGVPSV